jgi:hypothetical protein
MTIMTAKHSFKEALSVVGEFSDLEELVLFWIEAKTGQEGSDVVDSIDAEFSTHLYELVRIWGKYTIIDIQGEDE